ncbi:MAG: DUF2029 domain-containing protein [Nitrospirae bacterium]|nr:MAG: DUF2029 domain-containing protein [Nitrospirota bacterium]
MKWSPICARLDLRSKSPRLGPNLKLAGRIWLCERKTICLDSLPVVRNTDDMAGKGQTAASSLSGNESLKVLLCVVVSFSLLRYLHDLVKFLVESPFIDFAHYYTYATVVSLGLDPFDQQATSRVDAMLNIRRAGSAPNYPPLFYVFMQPLVLLPFRYAKLAWVFMGQVCLLGSLFICLRQVSAVSPVRVAAVLFVVLNYQPLAETIALGQSNLVVLFLVTVAWWGLRNGYQWAAATALALTAHIKPQFAVLLLLLWWMGYGAVGARALLLAGIGLGASFFVLGPDHHFTYARYVTSLPDYLLTWTANLSPRATLHRLFEPANFGPVLADSLWLTLGVGLLFLVARVIPRALPSHSPAFDGAWGLGLCAVLLLSPLTEEHHLVILLLPLTLLLLNGWGAHLPDRETVVLVGSILLLGSRYSLEQFPAFHQGALSLLMTGKLLGMIGLTGMLAARLLSGTALLRADPAKMMP